MWNLLIFYKSHLRGRHYHPALQTDVNPLRQQVTLGLIGFDPKAINLDLYSSSLCPEISMRNSPTIYGTEPADWCHLRGLMDTTENTIFYLLL